MPAEHISTKAGTFPRLAALLLDDHDPESARKARTSPVAPAAVSAAAKAKAATRQTTDGHPVHSFRTLLQDLATLTRNLVRLGDAPPAVALATPTLLQRAVFEKLGVPLTVSAELIALAPV